MEAVINGGAPAPVENVNVTPTAPPDGQATVEAVKPAEPPKPEEREPSGVAKRIKELTDARRAAEAREARLLALLEQQRTAPPPPRPAQEERILTRADFGHDDAKYLAYVERRLEAKAEESAKALAERYRSEQEAIERRARFEERLDAYGKTREDFDSVVSWLQDNNSPISEGMADFFFESDEVGLIAEYLHNNEAEAKKLARLSPAKAGRELQRLEDRLVAERKKAAEKPVSQAPPPAPRIEAAGDPGARLDPTSAESDALSDREWMRLREKQVQRKRS